MQPMFIDADGRVRFCENKIVRALLDWATPRGFDLNHIAVLDFTQDDRCQFAQLIGYSLKGYHGLSYVSDEHAAQATQAARRLDPKAAGCRDSQCAIHCGVALESSQPVTP